MNSTVVVIRHLLGARADRLLVESLFAGQRAIRRRIFPVKCILVEQQLLASIDDLIAGSNHIRCERKLLAEEDHRISLVIELVLREGTAVKQLISPLVEYCPIQVHRFCCKSHAFKFLLHLLTLLLVSLVETVNLFAEEDNGALYPLQSNHKLSFGIDSCFIALLVEYVVILLKIIHSLVKFVIVVPLEDPVIDRLVAILINAVIADGHNLIRRTDTRAVLGHTDGPRRDDATDLDRASNGAEESYRRKRSHFH